MAVPFEVAVLEGSGGPLVRVRGDLDMVSVAYLSDVLDGLASDGHVHLRLDLSDVTFVDSRGVAAIIAASRSWSRDGRSLEIVRGSPTIMRVFEALGIEAALPFVDP